MGMPPPISNCKSYTTLAHDDSSFSDQQSTAKTLRSIKDSVSYTTNNKNPDPTRFNITDVSVRGNYLACVVVYPNCTNYEGKKILVLKCTPQELYALKVLDPHFCDHDHISPIARFEPTDKGWKLALKLLDILTAE